MIWRFGLAAASLLGVLLLCQAGWTHGMGQTHDRADEQAKDAHQAHADHRYSRTVMQYTAPNVQLIDARGQSLGFRSALEADHRPVILQFIFTTCPGVCPILSSVMQEVQDIMGRDAAQVRMWSVSTDPEHDTPDRLLRYAEHIGAGAQWRFLTGKLQDIQTLQKAFTAFWGNKMDHEPLTFIWPGHGRAWVRLDGHVRAPELIAEYRSVVGR